MKFPKLIHVQIQDGGGEDGEDNDFLVAFTNGVVDIDGDDGPVAIYQLVSIGEVNTVKTYLSPGRKR